MRITKRYSVAETEFTYAETTWSWRLGNGIVVWIGMYPMVGGDEDKGEPINCGWACVNTLANNDHEIADDQLFTDQPIGVALDYLQQFLDFMPALSPSLRESCVEVLECLSVKELRGPDEIYADWYKKLEP